MEINIPNTILHVNVKKYFEQSVILAIFVKIGSAMEENHQRQYLEDYIFSCTQDQLKNKLSQLKGIDDMYLNLLENMKKQVANAEPDVQKSLEDQLRTEMSDKIYNEMSKNGLLTRELQSDLINGKVSYTFGGLSGHYSKLKQQLEQGIKKLDAAIEPIRVSNFNLEERIPQLTYNELKGAKEILTELFNNFLSNPENLRDQKAIKGLIENLDANGVLVPQFLDAYSQGNTEKLFRAKDSIIGKIDKEILTLDNQLKAHYEPHKANTQGLPLWGVLIVKLIESFKNGFERRPPKDPRIRNAHYPQSIKRKTILPIWAYIVLPYGLPALAAEMLYYKVTGYDRRTAPLKHNQQALAESADFKQTYLAGKERFTSQTQTYTYSQTHNMERRNELTERAKEQAEKYNNNYGNKQGQQQPKFSPGIK